VAPEAEIAHRSLADAGPGRADLGDAGSIQELGFGNSQIATDLVDQRSQGVRRRAFSLRAPRHECHVLAQRGTSLAREEGEHVVYSLETVR